MTRLVIRPNFSTFTSPLSKMDISKSRDQHLVLRTMYIKEMCIRKEMCKELKILVSFDMSRDSSSSL